MNTLDPALLQQLRAAAPYGVPADTLLTHARLAGHRTLTLPQLEQALRALADANLVAPLEGFTARWRITELGKSRLTEEGL